MTGTQVEFHSHVGDKLAFTCRLLRKALRQGATVLVDAPGVALDALDRALWTFDALSFVPHLRVGAGRAGDDALARTPIWLAEGAVAPPCPPVLINLGSPVQTDLAPFRRVIEVVGDDADDLRGGRERWRQYTARGLEPKLHPARAAGGAREAAA